MKQVVLEQPRRRFVRCEAQIEIPVIKAAPFCWSNTGKMIHRIRSAKIYCWKDSGKSHMAVQCWCGQSINNPQLGDDPPSKKPICATCEGRAIGAGQLGSPVIAGRVVLYTPRR